MKELHVEGVATHDGPESCVGVREDDGEALTGARAGRALSREIKRVRVPMLLSEAEGNTSRGAIASPGTTRRGRRPLARTESSCARTGRSPRRPRQMAARAASGRLGADRR
jgi:hypothetical protein